MKTRLFPDSNYRALYVKGKTLRMAIDPKKPITPLEFPEFYDVKITDKCNGACSYCYQSSTAACSHYRNVPAKIRSFFGPMTENERPFQVAIGGGEPTLHPEFADICRTFKSLGIDPNYTTNGTNITETVLEATENYVNGVAVSCHEHLDWRSGVTELLDAGVYTNLHLIISDEASVDRFMDILSEFSGRVKHFVLLPLIHQGRASDGFSCWDYLARRIEELSSISDIAFGALFHPFLKDTATAWNISMYDPESMSKYMVMDDDMFIYPSSFQTNEPINKQEKSK